MGTKARGIVVRLLIFIGLACPQLSCGGPGDARALWTEVLKKCSSSDLLGKSVLYFGASNITGPGSVWRRTADSGYNLRWVASDLGTQASVVTGSSASCQGASSVTLKLSANVDLQKVVPTIDAGVSADFQNAREVTVSVNGFHWDLLKEGTYEQTLRALPDNIKVDLQAPGRFVMVKGLAVSGLTAELKFGQTLSSEVKAKYSGAVPIGGGLQATVASDTSLKISSAADFVIAGELNELRSGGLAGGGQKIVGAPLTDDVSKVPVGTDPRPPHP